MKTLATEFLRVPLTQIRPDPTQSRTFFDPAKLEDLKESLLERGLINPIAVRKSGDLYDIIAGERRYRAAALLGWKEIDCRVYPPETPALETELLSLVENLQRVDLNPLEEARGYRQLTQPPYEMSQSAIAKKVGKKQSAISEALALLQLAPEVQEIIARAIISPRHARLLAKITNVERQIALAQEAATKDLSVNELKGLMEKHLKPSVKKTAPPDTPFTFSSQGTQVTMTALFEINENLDDFLMKLRTAYLVWNAQRMVPPAARSATQITRVVSPVKADKNPAIAFPQTPKELAELEVIGAKGPGPIYAKLLGPDSYLAKSTQTDTWQDYHAKDAKEGLPKLLAALRSGIK